MSDSTENTKDLDSYGVWVKRPPQDAPENETLPDFSDIENITSEETSQEEPIVTDESNLDSLDLNETSLSDAELSDISQNMEETSKDETPAQEEKTPEPEVEDFAASFDDGEISLDDFMDGGFTDPNPGAAPTETKPKEESIDFGGDGEISLDDFLDDVSEDSNKADDVSNDDPLDIDLSFTEGDEVPTEDIQTEDENEEYSDSDNNGEYDDMFGEIDNSNSEKKAESTFDSSKTEELSLDDFGIDESSDDATAVAAGAAVNASASTEEVNLSDFGIDSDAGETPVHQDVQGAKKGQVVDYDLAVTEEEATSSAPTVTEIKTSDSELEDVEPVEEAETSSVSNKLLEQIIADLSGLKNEINSLKGQFEELKSKETIVPTEKIEEQTPIDEPKKGVDVVPAEQTGFFNDSDEDETIALNGAELDNIINTVDIAEEETQDSKLKETEGIQESEKLEIPEVSTEETTQLENTSENAEEVQEAVSQEENPIEAENLEVEAEPDVFQNNEPSSPITEDVAIPSKEEIAPDSKLEEPLEVVESAEEPTPATEDINATFSDDNPFAEIGEPSVEIPEEEHDSGLSLDTENENLEEPNLDNIEEDIEDEISIPKAEDIVSEEPHDDILVESSTTDLMSSVNDSSENFEMPQPQDSFENVEEVETLDEVAEDETQNAETVQAASEEMPETSNEANTYFEEDTSESPLTDENLDYLKDEEVAEEAITEELPSENKEAEIETESSEDNSLPSDLKADVKSVLQYMDQLLENLPEDKIMEFAKSEQFTTYKKLFKELGLS